MKSLDEKRWVEAIHYLKEVESMQKWKDVYGSKIYANLGKFEIIIYLTINLQLTLSLH
jgi:hypothetical protein